MQIQACVLLPHEREAQYEVCDPGAREAGEGARHREPLPLFDDPASSTPAISKELFNGVYFKGTVPLDYGRGGVGAVGCIQWREVDEVSAGRSGRLPAGEQCGWGQADRGAGAVFHGGGGAGEPGICRCILRAAAGVLWRAAAERRAADESGRQEHLPHEPGWWQDAPVAGFFERADRKQRDQTEGQLECSSTLATAENVYQSAAQWQFSDPSLGQRSSSAEAPAPGLPRPSPHHHRQIMSPPHGMLELPLG